jgi:hypothetical protein
LEGTAYNAQLPSIRGAPTSSKRIPVILIGSAGSSVASIPSNRKRAAKSDQLLAIDNTLGKLAATDVGMQASNSNFVGRRSSNPDETIGYLTHRPARHWNLAPGCTVDLCENRQNSFRRLSALG